MAKKKQIQLAVAESKPTRTPATWGSVEYLVAILYFQVHHIYRPHATHLEQAPTRNDEPLVGLDQKQLELTLLKPIFGMVEHVLLFLKDRGKFSSMSEQEKNRLVDASRVLYTCRELFRHSRKSNLGGMLVTAIELGKDYDYFIRVPTIRSLNEKLAKVRGNTQDGATAKATSAPLSDNGKPLTAEEVLQIVNNALAENGVSKQKPAGQKPTVGKKLTAPSLPQKPEASKLLKSLDLPKYAGWKKARILRDLYPKISKKEIEAHTKSVRVYQQALERFRADS